MANDMNVTPASVRMQAELNKADRKDALAVNKIENKATPLEKAAQGVAMAGAAAGRVLTGGDIREGAAKARAVGDAVTAAEHDLSVNALIEMLPGNADIVDVGAGLAKAQKQQEEKEVKALGTTFVDQAGAAFMEMTALPVLLRTLDRKMDNSPVDPAFDYMKQRDIVEYGLPEEDRQFLRESVSDVDLANRMDEVAKRHERYQTLGAHGQGMAIAASLTGGILDPVGWAAGLGVGKAAQLAGMGGRVALMAGETGKAAGLMAAEGAVGNVLTEAALDAAGGHVTANDYVIAAGFGAVFGQLGMLGGGRAAGPLPEEVPTVPPAPHRRTDLATGADYTLKDGTPVVVTASVDQWGDGKMYMTTPTGEPVGSAFYGIGGDDAPSPFVEEAYRRRGANTLMYDLIHESGGATGVRESGTARTSDGQAFWDGYAHGQSVAWRDGVARNPIEEMMNNAQQANVDLYARAQARAGEQATPDEIRAEADRIQLEEADFVNRTAFADVPEVDRMFPVAEDVVNHDGTLNPLSDSLTVQATREDVMERWGINDTLVENADDRVMMSEVIARAEYWTQANPLNAERADSILARAPWLASTGLVLARSQNPVARMIAGTLLESTTGTTGRRRTAAIAKSMRERVYMGDLEGYETAYKQYRNRTGGSAYRDVLGSDHRSSFDRAVAMERENRRVGGPLSDDPTIRSAADVLDNGYNRMRLDQQRAGTVGSSRLGDTSVGYVHRAISQQWVMRASNAELQALSNKLAEQLDTVWTDPAFAKQIAARYVERARTGAYGGTSVPANLQSPEAASALKDTLRAMGVAEDDIERAMGRFSRGGASHTKKRLELDLSERVDVPGGQSFSLMDAFETDQAGLYTQYARRVSGDVALTQYGIMGDAGMSVIRKAMEYGPDGKRATVEEMRAFDQIAAEFYGRPLEGTGNKHLGNLRMLTAASRLGGMAFTQFAEMANSVALLGVSGALKQVSRMPGLISDVYNGRPSPILQSIEQIGGPLGQDHRVVFPFQEPNDVKVYGRDSLNAFDRIVRAGNNALPWLSGWHMVHGAQVRGMSEQIVHKSMRYIQRGEENSALSSMGIGPDIAARLRNDLPNIAEFDEAGNLVALDLSKATDSAAVAEYVQAVHRGSKQIIQGTYIGETGAWAHNDLLRLLVQFRSFSITSMEKQWTRQRVDLGTAKAFGLLMGQMSFALPIHLARVSINATAREDKEAYLETQLHPAMLARAVLNYTSISGLSGDILDAAASATGYEASGVRGNSGSVLGNVPALGYVESAGKVFKDRDAKEAIRMLPGGNLPFLTPVVNAATQD